MFKLTSDSEFDSRSKDIFASIDKDLAQAKRQSPIKDIEKNSPHEHEATDEDKKKTTEDFKGRESIFRSPKDSGWSDSRSRKHHQRDHSSRHKPYRSRPNHKVPDHVVNPKKYTKYTLSDVSRDQMSDRSNTRAAFDFLKELKDRQQPSSSQDGDQLEENDKVTFKKPVRNKSSPPPPLLVLSATA